jgi:signal peptidase I
MTVVQMGQPEEKKRTSLLRARVTPVTALIVILVIVALRLWVVETAIVGGHSMRNALMSGDRVLVLKPLGLRRFDIAVFKDPQGAGVAIKRVVGLPGDIVEMRPRTVRSGGEEYPAGVQLYINGAGYDRPNTISSEPRPMPPFRVPENSYFLLGDNLDVSVDSRQYGPVERSNIDGVGVAVLYPPQRMRLLVPDEPAPAEAAAGIPR